MRQKAKRDFEEPGIVEALRRAGCFVDLVSEKGQPDLDVTLPGGSPVLMMEVKGKRGRLSDAQVRWWKKYVSWLTPGWYHQEMAQGNFMSLNLIADWHEFCTTDPTVIPKAFIVRTIDEALSLVEEYRR